MGGAIFAFFEKGFYPFLEPLRALSSLKMSCSGRFLTLFFGYPNFPKKVKIAPPQHLIALM